MTSTVSRRTTNPRPTYEGPEGPRAGHAAVRTAHETSAIDSPGLEVRIVREFTSSPDCSALESCAVLVDAEGRRPRARGINVVVVRDGTFDSVRSYEDPPMPL